MYQVTDVSLERLLKACRTLHGKLVASPVWELIKTEPVITEWINALRDVEGQTRAIKSSEVFPENQSER